MTPQRALVWRALVESGGHFTADGLWEKVRGSLPGLELSTVYRSLEVLRAAGLVAESRPPEGPRVFEARPALHPHMVCDVCGRIFHPAPEAEGRMLAALDAAAEGFEVRELHVMVRGTCSGCADTDENGATDAFTAREAPAKQTTGE